MDVPQYDVCGVCDGDGRSCINRLKAQIAPCNNVPGRFYDFCGLVQLIPSYPLISSTKYVLLNSRPLVVSGLYPFQCSASIQFQRLQSTYWQTAFPSDLLNFLCESWKYLVIFLLLIHQCGGPGLSRTGTCLNAEKQASIIWDCALVCFDLVHSWVGINWA